MPLPKMKWGQQSKRLSTIANRKSNYWRPRLEEQPDLFFAKLSRSAINGNTLSYPAILRAAAKLLLYPQEPVVLLGALRPARRSKLYLPRIQGNGKV